MTKQVTYRTVHRAMQCIDHDPDLWPDDAATAIVCNRGVLEEALDSYQQRERALVMEHGEQDESGQVTVEEADADFQRRHQDILDETVTVSVRTVSIDVARTLTTAVAEKADEDEQRASLSDWHWMIE